MRQTILCSLAKCVHSVDTKSSKELSLSQPMQLFFQSRFCRQILMDLQHLRDSRFLHDRNVVLSDIN